MKRPRSVGLCVFFSIITLGIYYLYWLYHIHNDAQEVCGYPMTVSGGVVVLLHIVTGGIYTYYWMYKTGQFLDTAKGQPGGNSGILYMVLKFFGLGIVSLAIMQSELNRFTLGYDGL